MAMQYSEEKYFWIDTGGYSGYVYYKSALDAWVDTSKSTGDKAVVKGSGGGLTKWIDGRDSQISFSGGVNYSYSTKGVCYPPNYGSDWNYTNWWWDSFTYETVDKGHETRELTYSCNFNFNYKGNASVSVKVTIPAKTKYTVSYNGNSTYNSYTNSTVSNLPGNDNKWYNETFNVSSTVPTKASTTVNGPTVTFNYNYSGSTNTTDTPIDTYIYTFSKWNTSSNGTGTNYNSGSSYTTNEAITFYAVWNRTLSPGSVTLPTPTRPGFTFLGWSSDSSADTGDYAGGDEYTPTGATTLYAIWRANLGNAYVLKTTIPNVTWQTLITDQSTVGSTLYDAGGQYNGWGYDGNYVTCFGKRIKYNNSYVLKTSTPVRGGTYYYYE